MAVWESGCQTCWHCSHEPHYSLRKPLNGLRGGCGGNRGQHFPLVFFFPLLHLHLFSSPSAFFFFIFFLPLYLHAVRDCLIFLAVTGRSGSLDSERTAGNMQCKGATMLTLLLDCHGNCSPKRATVVSRTLPCVIPGRNRTMYPFFKRNKAVITCIVTGLCKCSLSM